MYRSLVVSMCVLSCSLAARGAAAQGTALQDRAREVRAAEDSLLGLQRAAERAAYPSDSARTAERLRRDPVDSIRVGPLLVVGQRSVLRYAEPAFREAWSYYEPLIGRAANRLEGQRFAVVEGGRNAVYQTRDSTRVIRVPIGRPRLASPELNLSSAYHAIGKALVPLLPFEVRSWLFDVWGVPGQLESAYRHIARSGADGTRRCMRREIPACVGVLGLQGEDWSTWYSVEQLQNLIRNSDVLRASPYAPACFRNDAHACIDVYRSRSTRPNTPLGGNVRQALMLWTLEKAGAGSFEKLMVPDSSDVATRLVSMTGRPLPDLISEFRNDVELARPRARADAGRAAIAGILWSVVFSFFALRSTRWRIG